MDKATKRIQSKIKVQHSAGMKGESWDNQAIARDLLFDELGYNRSERPHYYLDDQTKNILLTHARQDASHALANTISILERVDKLDRTVRILCIFIITSGITIAYLLWKIAQTSQI